MTRAEPVCTPRARMAHPGMSHQAPVLPSCGHLLSNPDCAHPQPSRTPSWTRRTPGGSPQGRGIGRRLLRALLALWDAENGGGLVLATQEEHALRLYKAHGFQEREDGPATPAAAPADSRSSDGPTAVAGTAGMAAQDPGNGGGAAYKSWALVRPAQLPPAEAVK